MTPADLNRAAWGFVQGFGFIVFVPLLLAIVAILFADGGVR